MLGNEKTEAIVAPISVILCEASLLFSLLSAMVEALAVVLSTTTRKVKVFGIVAGIVTVVCKAKVPPMAMLDGVFMVCKSVLLA